MHYISKNNAHIIIVPCYSEFHQISELKNLLLITNDT